jgi:hypothetical protein
MQVLSAPNREELVQAHAKRYWLHIGVPSLRNLRYIGKDRSIIWCLLFLTSVPLHLLFNSVVFTNLQANKYAVIPTTKGWLDGGEYDTSGFIDVDPASAKSIISSMEFYRPALTETVGVRNGSTMMKYKIGVNTDECFDLYNNQYLSDIGNVYLVQENPTVWRNTTMWYPNISRTLGNFTWTKRDEDNRAEEARILLSGLPFISSPDFYPSNGWRCASHAIKQCDVENHFEVPQDRSQWQPYESPIRECVVEQVEEQCQLQFSFVIAIIVIASNVIKALCMAFLLIKYKSHVALVTLGDALASFLEKPDPETRSRCLHGRQLMEAEWNWELTHGASKGELGVEPEKFVPKRFSWATAPGAGRWLSAYVL